jgi:predicted transcriptional regulator
MDSTRAEEKIDRWQMTLEALADVDTGHVIEHQEVEAWVKSLVDRAERVMLRPE